ncbi:MAG TPA: phosphoribosylglycinamide synthetase, partial [Chloroflexota bacterium]
MNASTYHRVILLTPSLTYRANAFLEAAARLELEVVRGLDMPSPLAKYWHPTLPLDFRAPDRAVRDLVRFARANPVRAILSVDDAATVIAARACEALGLSHNPPSAAAAASGGLCDRPSSAQARAAITVAASSTERIARTGLARAKRTRS